jgi:hypothetical protein
MPGRVSTIFFRRSSRQRLRSMLASQCRPFAQDNLILAKLIRPRRWPGCGRSPPISIPTTSFASSVRQRRRRAAGARRAADDPPHPRARKTGRPLLKQGHRTRAASRSDSSSAVTYLERLRAAGALDDEAAEITYSQPSADSLSLRPPNPAPRSLLSPESSAESGWLVGRPPARARRHLARPTTSPEGVAAPSPSARRSGRPGSGRTS